MPELPAKLIELYCHNNILTTLPKLPSNLLILDCFDNKLTSLPELQNSLRELNCNNNYLTFLPELPDSLIQLSCDNNKLTSLPKLPQTLENLFCNSIELTSLPELPNSIQILHCNGNNLEYLPELPKSLRIFSCSNNKWKEPIKKEIVDKFNLYALYTKEHIELFSSEEYQRDFLTEHPERFQDLSCEGITVHPVIRKEFSYIFEGEGMGFFNLVKESKDISDDEKIYFIKKCVDIYAEKKQYKPSLIPKEIYGLYLNDLPFYDNYFVKYIEKFLLGDNAYYYVKFNNKENPENSNFSRNIYNCDCDELSIIYDYLVKQYPDMGSIIEGDKMGFFDLKTNESK